MGNAGTILEIGLVLLGAAGLGSLARRAGLPAVVGYLALGIAVSPFTPGYVADRHQIELLADVGVVLLLFEVGIEVDLPRLRREHAGLLWAAPVQVLLSGSIAGAAFLACGIEPLWAAILGLCVALSSSVVIVNITRSRRRTTDPPTEAALLGWSVLQDVTGVAVAAGLLAALGAGGRPFPIALGGLAVFVALAIATAWLLPRVVIHLREQPDTFLIVSVASGLGPGRPRVRRLRRSAGVGGIRGRPGDRRGPGHRRGPPATAALPRPFRRAVLRGHRHVARPG